MPVSKSKRRRFQPPPRPRPKPSPRWIPVVVLALLAFGVADLILYYLSGTNSSGKGFLFWLNQQGIKPLIAGFVAIAGGFGLATKWR